METDPKSIHFLTPDCILKLVVAGIFDILKFVFTLFFFFAPIILGFAAGMYAQNVCQDHLPSWVPGTGWVCKKTGQVVGVVVAGGGYFAEIITGGVAAAGIEAVGEVIADALDFMAWTIFFLWFLIEGRSFIGTKRGTTQLFISAGSAMAGLVPLLNTAPTITIGIFFTEYQYYRERKQKALVEQKKFESLKENRLAAQQAAYAALQAQQQAAQEEVYA